MLTELKKNACLAFERLLGLTARSATSMYFHADAMVDAVAARMHDRSPTLSLTEFIANEV